MRLGLPQSCDCRQVYLHTCLQLQDSCNVGWRGTRHKHRLLQTKKQIIVIHNTSLSHVHLASRPVHVGGQSTWEDSPRGRSTWPGCVHQWLHLCLLTAKHISCHPRSFQCLATRVPLDQWNGLLSQPGGEETAGVAESQWSRFIHLSKLWDLLRLVPKPPLFLPSVCVYNNAREHCANCRLNNSSAPVYCCEHKWKVKTGEAWKTYCPLSFSLPACRQAWRPMDICGKNLSSFCTQVGLQASFLLLVKQLVLQATTAGNMFQRK